MAVQRQLATQLQIGAAVHRGVRVTAEWSRRNAGTLLHLASLKALYVFHTEEKKKPQNNPRPQKIASCQCISVLVCPEFRIHGLPLLVIVVVTVVRRSFISMALSHFLY